MSAIAAKSAYKRDCRGRRLKTRLRNHIKRNRKNYEGIQVNNMKKRLFSIFLALAMVFSLFAAMPIAMGAGNIYSSSDWTGEDEDNMGESDGTHTVTFNSMGGSSVAPATYELDSLIVEPAAPTRSGYVFGGWYTEQDCTNKWNFASDRVTENITLFANWTLQGSAGMSNFKSTGAYMISQFTDVNEDQWYGLNDQKVIARAFEYGLMKGNSATTFNPTGNVTVAEAITIAARVHSIYATGAGNFAQGNPWYQVYVDYAVANEIIADKYFTNFARAATRAEMAFIFSRSLPSGEFTEINTINSLPDVISGTPYRESILMLYRAGILTGSDTLGTFYPANNVTRAEAAAIISRVILPDTRVGGRTY